jgi:general secretion pathway protein G
MQKRVRGTYWARKMRYYPNVNARCSSTNRGFTVLELLIVVTVIGLVSALALPNVVAAIQRARQSRTMADMRSIAGALVLYEQDFVDYPIETSLASAENLRPHILPYLGDFKATDGWKRPYWYVSDGHIYTLISYALGGNPDPPYAFGPTHRLEDDIVMSEGMFVQWPEGVQN